MTVTNSEGGFDVDAGDEKNQDEAWSCSVEPCLVISHGESEKPLLTFYDTSQHTHNTMVFHELKNKYVIASHGDWLLVRDVNIETDYCILNAMTKQKFQLPSLCKEEFSINNYSSFLLSHSPDHGDAVNTVYLFSSCASTILYCKIGADQFTEKELPEGEDYVIKATIFQGKMYYLTLNDALYCAELHDSSPLQFRECIGGEELMAVVRFSSIHLCNLVGSRDQLLYIMGRCLDMGAVDFQVLGADLSGKIWERVYSIGSDRAIYVDAFKGFSAHIPSECGVKGNCIYYISDQDEGDEDLDNVTLFRYDLKDPRVKMLPSFPFKIHGRTLPRLRWISSHF